MDEGAFLKNERMSENLYMQIQNRLGCVRLFDSWTKGSAYVLKRNGFLLDGHQGYDYSGDFQIHQRKLHNCCWSLCRHLDGDVALHKRDMVNRIFPE